jgi:hypothetical protein
MATLLDLFKERKQELYGRVGTIYIDSRGIINPPRGAALLTSSPDGLTDVAGAQVAGLIKGLATRPSDTIYRNKIPLTKPVSITAVTNAQLRDVIEPGEKYFVKRTAAPNIVGGFIQGASNPQGAIANAAIQAANTYGSVKKLKKLVKQLREGPITIPDNPEQYGTQFMPNTKFGNTVLAEDKLFSNWQRDETGKLVKRDVAKNWNLVGLNDRFEIAEGDVKKEEKTLRDKGQVYVLFKKEGNDFRIPFAAVLSGISEDVIPEWTSFRYVGSPFKVYKYIGVERSLKFELKIYYSTKSEKDIMIQKINYLKSLAFPFESISQITYQDSPANQYAFSPNFVYLTIGDLYKNIYGHIESLSFNIEDNTTWPSENSDDTIYPSVINVSVSMKIIENHKTDPENINGKIVKYKYDFDGRIGYEKVGVVAVTTARAPITIPSPPRSLTATPPTLSSIRR